MASILSTATVRTGLTLQFIYPLDNRACAPVRFQCRRLLVDRIRDLSEDPLDPLSYQLRPDLRRGQFLVSGHDLDRHERRQFYLDSARDVRELSVRTLRLALYDPLRDSGPLRWIGPVWTDGANDRRAMQIVLQQWNQHAMAQRGHHCLLAAFHFTGFPHESA